ncbi:MAG: PAS domain S-box protein [Armatimonadota bacterium]
MTVHESSGTESTLTGPEGRASSPAPAPDWRQLFEAAPSAMIGVDRTGRVLFANRLARELLGWSDGDPAATGDFRPPFSARSWERWREYLRRCFDGVASHRPQPIELDLSLSDDETVTVEIVVSLLEPADPGVAVCALREISRGRREDRDLRAAERCGWALEALPAGIALLDETGRIVYVNPAGQGIWAGAEYVGIEDFGLYRGWFPESRESIRPEQWAAARAVLNGEACLDEVLEIESFEGDRKVVRHSAVPLRGRDGGPHGAVVLIQDVTQQQRDEQAIRDAERRYRTLSDAIPHIVWSCDPDGQVQYLNRKWLEFTGVALEELNERGWGAVIHPTDLPKMPALWKASNRTGEVFETELRFRRHDGVYRWFLARGLPLRDPDGAVREWIGTSTDISVLKETEDALRESEARFRAAMERAPIGMALVGLDGLYLKVNHALCELTGYSEAELTRMTFQSITHPEDLERDTERLEQLLSGVIRTYETEKRYLRRDGSLLWILLTTTLVRGDDGAPLYFVSQMLDITERKRSTETLARSEAEYRAIFELAAVGVTETEPQTGRFLRVNRRFCEITGYEQDELLSMSLLDLTHPEDRYRTEENLRAVAEGRSDQWILEKRCVRKDGNTIWVRLDGTLLRDAEGRPYRRITMVQDISDRKRAEQALQEAHALQEAILNAADYAIVSTDERGIFRSFNRGAERMLGYTAAEIVGKEGVDRVLEAEELRRWGEDRLHRREFTPEERFRKALEDLAAGEEIEREWTAIRKDGSRFPVLISLTALRDVEGAVCGMVGIARDITRRKRAELRLQQQARLLDLAHDAIVVRDLSGRIAYWNSGAERTYGFSKAEVLGRSMAELVGMPPEVMEAISAELQRRGAWEGELVQRTRTGEQLIVASRHVLQTGEDGVPAAVLEINRDVTWQKQAEEERARQSLRWLLLSEAAGELLETEDPVQVVRSLFERVSTHAGVDSFIYLVAQEEGQALALCSYAGLEGTGLEEYFSTQFWDSICGRAAQLRAPQYASDLQERSDTATNVLREHGVRAFCSYPLLAGDRLLGTLSFGSHSRREFDADELTLFASISHYLAIAMERARLLASERRQTRLFRTVLQALPVGVWLADPNGRILMGNPEAHRIWGGSADFDIQAYFPRHGWWADTGQSIRPEEWASARAARYGEVRLNELIVIEAADGTRKTIRNSAIPVRDEDGEAYGVVVLNEDVTDEKRAAAERERLLQSEQQKSEQLELAIREAHHRIKNNLQAITDLLSLELFSARTREVADPLRESMERVQAIALVHDLLSRDEDVETVDIRHLAQRLIPTVLQSNGINLGQAQVQTEIPSLCLPSRQATALALILNELISNAAKHALKGRNGRLEVRVLEEDEDVLLVVQDDGPGLPAGFELDRHGNVGLGVVQALIQSNMSGRMRMLNQAGLRVELRFPRRDKERAGGERADTDL